jgi:hypothetical protein
MKRPTLYNFLCMLCFDCIYYETDLRDFLLYCRLLSYLLCLEYRFHRLHTLKMHLEGKNLLSFLVK